MEKEEEFDTEWTGQPVCPHCGTEDSDWWDGLREEKRDGDSWQMTCGACYKSSTVTIYVSYDFSTEKISEEKQ